MITYTQEEIIPSTTVSINFEDILNKLVQRELLKVAVVRNDKIEAILLPLESFEQINDLSEMIEHIEIYRIIKEREETGTIVDFETVLSNNGIILNDL